MHREITNIKMIVQLFPLLLLTTVNPSSCSLVIDTVLQNWVNFYEYCPNTRTICKEGDHVMCRSYNQGVEFGPGCITPVPKVTITAEIAGQILDLVNMIRSKVANGIEKGLNNTLLPRGYGIFRMHWDSELATFAQLTANQCSKKHDICRATKRFTNPSQLMASSRYSYSDWKARCLKGDSIYNVTTAQLVFAVTKSIKTWYNIKKDVTEDMLKSCPDYKKAPQPSRFYLTLIQGPATHMGCGLSVFSEFSYQTSNQTGNVNVIQLVCNFSEDLRKGAPSYAMNPPIPMPGYSMKCGCPPGFEEDDDCLCNMAKPTPPPEPTCPFGENSGNDCESTLVLLPIFTMEDAPPNKLYQVAEETNHPLKNYILQRVNNTSNSLVRHGNMGPPTSMEMSEFMHTKKPENNRWQNAHKPLLSQSHAPWYNKVRREPQVAPVLLSVPPPPPPPRRVPARSSPRLRQHLRPRLRPPPPPLRIPPPPSSPPRIPPPPPPSPAINLIKSLKNHDDTTANHVSHDRSRPLPKLPVRHRAFVKKASIFTRVPQFQLPDRRSMPPPLKVIKKDVAPRKDFSNLNKVVNEYLKRHLGYKIIDHSLEQNKPKEEAKSHAEEKSQIEAVITDTGLSNAEETVIHFNQYLSKKNNSYYNEKGVNIKDDNDKKLLSLLDTLEREVKHIELDGSEKELFDAKIRKIYGSIVGKTALVKFPKPILLGTADQETPEIEFGETKSNEKLKPDEEDNHIKVPEEPRELKHYKVDKGVGRIKQYNPSIDGHIQSHRWQNKFIDSFDRKKGKENMDDWNRKSSNTFNHKYNENLGNAYGDIDHKHMDEIDRKYKENINKKYSENHLDQEYNVVQLKLSDNLHHQHHYDSDRKYDNDEPAASSKMTYVAARDGFREFEHNSQSSQEDPTHRNFRHKDLKYTNHGIPDIRLITKDREKIKKSERKHRSRVKSLNSHKNPTDTLSLERRKYYQEKLDNIKRKLRNRKNRVKNDPKNKRSLRRMQTKIRESARTRTKSEADNFYMPEGARFLHGF